MKYPSHRKSREESRGLDVGYLKEKQPICEWCRKNKAGNIHHIENAYRGSKKRHEEGHQLLALCNSCHTYIHNHNTFEMREKERALALKIIEGVNTMQKKEK